MKKQLTIEEKQEVLLEVLMSRDENFAVFGIEKEVVKPLIKQGKIHADTYRYTGGARLTKKGRGEVTNKLYWVATDPETGIMKVSCDFRDIMGHFYDDIREIFTHSSESARLEYQATKN